MMACSISLEKGSETPSSVAKCFASQGLVRVSRLLAALSQHSHNRLTANGSSRLQHSHPRCTSWTRCFAEQHRCQFHLSVEAE